MRDMTQDTPRKTNLTSILFYGILFLFFFQLIADFIEAIYAFGLLGTSIPPELISILFLFSPLLLLLRRRGLSGRSLALVGRLLLFSRLVEVMLDTGGRMLLAGLGVSCFLLLLPSLLWREGQDGQEQEFPIVLGGGLALAVALSILLRALGSGLDVSTFGWTQAIGWVLVVVAAWLLPDQLGRPGPADDKAPRKPAAAAGHVVILSLGITAALTLLYFAFASPAVIVRWSGASYWLVLTLVLAALSLFALLLAARPARLLSLKPPVLLAWNALFLLSLTLTLRAHQIDFPPQPAAYPLYEPAVPAWSPALLALLLISFPVILADFVHFSRALMALRPSSRSLGGGFALGSLFLLVIVLAQVFTTVYDYIPVVGPFFRDKFWLVFLAAGIVLVLPVLLMGGRLSHAAASTERTRLSAILPGAIATLAVAAIGGALLVSARPAARPDPQPTLKVLTYNIQQGYSEDGRKNHAGQLALLRQVNADVIGLQESDSARIAGGNGDIVRYFADALDMHAYYGPKVAPGTFGIALLSKYPIENPRTFYMHSVGEQTATISADVTVQGKTFHLFVTHLGNGGPMAQQEAFLQALAGQENVIALGDFNFRPASDQYRLTTATLDDAWLLRWPQGADDQGLAPTDRIDHVFVSPGTVVEDAQYLIGPQSDHPAVMVEIEL